MNAIQQIARSALAGDALATRSLVQDWLASSPQLADIPRPMSDDQTELSLAAALAELLAGRLGQSPPTWTADVGPAPRPTHLLRSAITMRRLRETCEAQSPLPLRQRLFYAPANYLEMR
jgi:hypothetical protein